MANHFSIMPIMVQTPICNGSNLCVSLKVSQPMFQTSRWEECGNGGAEFVICPRSQPIE